MIFVSIAVLVLKTFSEGGYPFKTHAIYIYKCIQTHSKIINSYFTKWCMIIFIMISSSQCCVKSRGCETGLQLQGLWCSCKMGRSRFQRGSILKWVGTHEITPIFSVVSGVWHWIVYTVEWRISYQFSLLGYCILGSFFLMFPFSSWKKGFLPGKNPFLPMGREEIPFFQENTQPCLEVHLELHCKRYTVLLWIIWPCCTGILDSDWNLVLIQKTY